VKFTKSSFIGGANVQYDPTRISDSEYPLLINGRNRKGTIRPIRKPQELAGAPGGLLQGLYAAGQYLILIANGEAWIKDVVAGGNFNRIPGFQLSSTAERVWAALVSASSMNFARVPASTGASATVNLTTAASKTPASAVFQDGVNQPWIIQSDGSSRAALTYSEWTTSNREYVPIGRQMLFSNGILYIVSQDGRTIYRSISGRPLDFMLNVAPTTGDKSGTEAESGASSVSHATGFDEITCLASLNSPDKAFFAATSNLSTSVVPDWENPIFGQPQFDNVDLFQTGPVNQFSFVETDGDSAFVNSRGIRSFNAALQERTEGKNTLFSARILDWFTDVVQSDPCTAKFDNYLFFGVETVYGSAVAVYDETLKCWVGLDMHDDVGAVKQFAKVEKGSVEKLFFITTDNKVYEAFASDETADCKLYIGDYCSQSPDVNQLPEILNVVLIKAEEDGEFTITPFIDGKRQDNLELTEDVEINYVAEDTRTVPFGEGDVSNVRNLPFALKRIDQGWKCGFLLEWNFMAEVSHVQATSEDQSTETPLKSQVSAYARLR
jgi:hypothetical protein